VSDEHISELQLIDWSRAQREVLERWLRICIDASEVEIAEELRAELSAPAMEIAA
jgi:hypothetical protein